MSKQVLDIEQMKHLNELGVNTDEASFCVNVKYPDKQIFTYDTYYSEIEYHLDVQPVFTLQDILCLLPREIHPKDSTFSTYYLFIDYYYKQISYSEQLDYGEYKGFSFSHNNILIDAAYEMLCWCIEKGYISTDK